MELLNIHLRRSTASLRRQRLGRVLHKRHHTGLARLVPLRERAPARNGLGHADRSRRHHALGLDAQPRRLRLAAALRASALAPTNVVSRKTHGGAGTFDINLPLTGSVGVECRSGGATNDYQMVISFATPVTVGGASVTSGTGSVSSFSVSGSQVTVNLAGVTNAQRITVTLSNVNGWHARGQRSRFHRRAGR
jgi:hypothetical protein